MRLRGCKIPKTYGQSVGFLSHTVLGSLITELSGRQSLYKDLRGPLGLEEKWKTGKGTKERQGKGEGR